MTYTPFMEKHKKAKRGENFDNLNSYFEMCDSTKGSSSLDYAFLIGNVVLNVDCDGIDSHAKEINRTKFVDHLVRQNHLILDGWKVHRYSYDDAMESPRMCRQILMQFMERWVSGNKANQVAKLSAEERDILCLALRRGYIVRAKDVSQLLAVDNQKARKLLHNLCTKKMLSSSGEGNDLVFSYKLNKNVTAADLGL